jgi:hypothetical protein
MARMHRVVVVDGEPELRKSFDPARPQVIKTIHGAG